MKLLLLLALLLPLPGFGEDRSGTYSTNIASLIAPANLATLGKHEADSRIQKAIAMLEEARLDVCNVLTVISNSVALAGYTNVLVADLTRSALKRNYTIAYRAGVFAPPGLEAMNRGQPPTIRFSPYEDDKLGVHTIIPVALAPELANTVANLELRSLKRSQADGDRIGLPERSLAQMLQSAGVITQSRFDEIQAKYDPTWTDGYNVHNMPARRKSWEINPSAYWQTAGQTNTLPERSPTNTLMESK